jgi:deferrochelatase/peroxidase EfeB
MTTEQKNPNPFVAQRAERVHQLLAKIKEKRDTPIDEILGKFAFDNDVSIKIARQYLRLLEQAQQISIEQKGVKYYARVLEE